VGQPLNSQNIHSLSQRSEKLGQMLKLAGNCQKRYSPDQLNQPTKSLPNCTEQLIHSSRYIDPL